MKLITNVSQNEQIYHASGITDRNTHLTGAYTDTVEEGGCWARVIPFTQRSLTHS